jgi:hypothetical protein
MLAVVSTDSWETEATIPISGLVFSIAVGPRVALACPGDCDRNEEVTVDELVRVTGVALGNLMRRDCPAADSNFDGQIAVDDIVTALTRALNRCAI